MTARQRLGAKRSGGHGNMDSPSGATAGLGHQGGLAKGPVTPTKAWDPNSSKPGLQNAFFEVTRWAPDPVTNWVVTLYE